MAGKRVRCPACQATLVVPDASAGIVTPDRVGTSVPLRSSQPGKDATGLPDLLGTTRLGRPAKPAPSGLTQLALACGVGLVVTAAVTGVIIVARSDQAGTAGAATAVPNNSATFKEFVSPEGKFRVILPGTPMQKRQQFGPVSLTMYTLENRDGAYMAGFCDVPIGANESEAMTQRRLDGAREGAVRNVNGALIREARIRLHGRDPGREIEANLPHNRGILRARVYIVGRRMYQVMVVGTPAWAHSADANRFLDSLSRTN
jgi:hypothetical protein